MSNRRSWDQLRAGWPKSMDAIAWVVDAEARVAIISCRDRPTITQWTKAVATLLTEPPWEPTFDLLVDFSDVADGLPFPWQVVSYTAAHREHFAGRMAVVTPSHNPRELLGAVANLPAHRRQYICAFATPAAAASWLGCV